MGILTVTTAAELEAAKSAKVNEILIVGQLAADIRKKSNFAKVGAGALVGLGIVGIAAKAFAPKSALGYSANFVQAITGSEISKIILASGVSIVLIIAVNKEYDTVKWSPKEGLYLKRKAEK